MKQLKNQPKCALGRVVRGHVPSLGRLTLLCGHSEQGKESRNTSRQGESGRSMVEMLGVLAIIGVLSVGGIAGYTTAMNKHRANQILNGASVRAIVVSTQIQRGATAPTLGEFTDNEVGGATFGTGVKNEAGTGDWTTTDKRFSLTLTGVSAEICAQMKASVGQNSIIREINEGCTTITYNNDLTATTFITDNKDSTSCKSAGGVWNNRTKTCGCPGRYTGSNCEVAPTSCPPKTTLTESGKCKYCNEYDESQCMECEMGDEILDSGYYVLVAECYNPKTENAKCGNISCTVCDKLSEKPDAICADGGDCYCYNAKTQNAECRYYHCAICDQGGEKPDTICSDYGECYCYNKDTQDAACSSNSCITCDKNSTTPIAQCEDGCSCVAE